MPRVHLSDEFFEALASLDQADVKRVVAFINKLVQAPSAASLRPEMVHDASDRTIRSFKVTHDLRSIARVEGDDVLLLHVDRHDRAYVWAKARCVPCMAEDAASWLVSEARAQEDSMPGTEVCSTTSDVCRVLSERGVSSVEGRE